MNTLNYKNDNIQELNKHEISNVNGGIFWAAVGAIATAVFLYDAVSDMHAGFVENYR